MAASPVSIAPALISNVSSNVRRRPLALTPRRLEANRRNAARSTGPRTAAGKTRVARNAIKHGFFVAQERWTPRQRRDFEETLNGLREELKPRGMLEESCVTTIAESYVRMAAMLHYENIAALKHHQHREREMNARIAGANPLEGARLRAQRDQLRRAGLWRPTIPGPREAMAIVRYSGSLDRSIRRASSELDGLKRMRLGEAPSRSIMQKQTHCEPLANSGREARRRTTHATFATGQNAKTNPLGGIADKCPEALRRTSGATATVNVNAKTNPLTSMFTGNRHERRRAKALATRQRPSL